MAVSHYHCKCPPPEVEHMVGSRASAYLTELEAMTFLLVVRQSQPGTVPVNMQYFCLIPLYIYLTTALALPREYKITSTRNDEEEEISQLPSFSLYGGPTNRLLEEKTPVQTLPTPSPTTQDSTVSIINPLRLKTCES